MKRIAIFCVAALAVACSDTETPTNPGGDALSGSCTALQIGSSRCNGTLRQVCNDDLDWASVQDCADDGLTCSDDLGSAICALGSGNPGGPNNGGTPQPEGATCSGSGQGNCEDGLVCRLGGSATFTCFRPCDSSGAGSECGVDSCVQVGASFDDGVCVGGAPKAQMELCMGVGQGNCQDGLTCMSGASIGISGSACVKECNPGSVATTCGGDEACLQIPTGGGICAPKVGRGEPCVSDDVCTTPGDTCALVDIGQVGGQVIPLSACLPGCALNEVGTGQGSCPSGLSCIASQVPDFEPGAQNQGVTCTTDAQCSQGDGYRCMEFQTRQGVQGQCARSFPICAEQIPFTWSAGPVPDELQCGFSDSAGNVRQCGVVGAAGEPAEALCASFSQGGPMVCVGLCEGDGGDKDCGDGFVCAGSGQFVAQPGPGGQQIACSPGDNSPCDGTQGFSCVQTSATTGACAKEEKLCRLPQ